MTNARVERPLLGVSLIIIAEVVLVFSGILIRELGSDISVLQLIFLRNAIGLVYMLLLVRLRGGISLRTSRIHLHFLRASVGVSAMACLYYGWTHLPLGTAALLKQTAPLFMPILGLWLLRESINPVLRWSLPVGFCGIALVLQPTNAGLQLAAIVGLAGAVLSALAKIYIRMMKETEPSRRIVFYFALFGTLISAPFALPQWTPLNGWQWSGVAAIGALSTLAQLAMTRAYHNAPAGYLGPFTYSSVIIATLLGWWIWDESLRMITLLGMAFILAGGVMTLRAGAK
ncbi:MAG TPA: DMT family transporter [Marinobacterium sp.]|nr:DMT family transporter [Marinobacterium sp.]